MVARIKKSNAILDNIIGVGDKEEIIKHEHEMLRLTKAELWNVYMDGNAEVLMELGFEKFMFLVADVGNVSLSELDLMSTHDFYALQDYLEEKHKS